MKTYSIIYWLIVLTSFSLQLPAQINVEVTPVGCGEQNTGSLRINVGISGNFEYQINNFPFQKSNFFDNLSPGTYEVTVREVNTECMFPGETVELSAGGSLGVGIREEINDDNICNGEIILNAEISGGSPPYQINWPDGRVRVNQTGWYELKVVDANGCEGLTRKYITIVPVQCSVDPNDILGPKGYTEENRWIAASDIIEYTIRFENDPDFATAPAQQVEIYHPIDAHIDPFSFRLTDFGFANMSFNVPDNQSFYSTRLDLRDSLGVFVDVTAGLDILENRAFWILSSVDPLTGLPPEDPQKGLLPVNDSISLRGEGYANFNVRPYENVITGDTAFAIADIIFDDNEPILTPRIFNRLDALPPQSTMSPPQMSGTDSLLLSWTGQDDPGGSGIQDYALFVSVDNGPFQVSRLGLLDTFVYFQVEEGKNYQFFTRATDNVGNVEPLKTSGDTTLDTDITPFTDVFALSDDEICAGDSLSIQWFAKGINQADILLHRPGQPPFIIVGRVDADRNTYTWPIPEDWPDTENSWIVVQDTTANSPGIDSIALVIRSRPEILITADTRICAGSTTQLRASGTANYQWTPSTGLNNPKLSNPTALPITSTTYQVTGTDDRGCRAEASVFIEVLPPDTTSVVAYTCAVEQTGFFTELYTNQAGCDSIVFIDRQLRTEDPSLTAQLNLTPSNDSMGGRIELIPEGGTPPYQIEWAFTEMDTTVLEGLAPGNYGVTIRDAANCTVQLPFQILLTDTRSPSLVDLKKFDLFPNPASSRTFLRITFQKAQTGQVFIFHPDGRLVRRIPFTHQTSVEGALEVSDWARGVYIIKVETAAGAASRSLVLE